MGSCTSSRPAVVPLDELIGEAGQVLVVPSWTPHKFAVLGPERYVATHIHASDEFITEWLEDE